MQPTSPRRLVVGISGSTGPHYGVRLLHALREHTDVEVHLVLSQGARKTIEYEMEMDPDEVLRMAHVVHDERNLASSLASGTFLTMGMVVVPCSIKTLSAVANSYNDNLLARAADVCLKERRRLVLVVRETPLSAIHLRNMLTLREAGATILFLAPGFYHGAETVDDLVDFVVGRALDQLGLENTLTKRWGQ